MSEKGRADGSAFFLRSDCLACVCLLCETDGSMVRYYLVKGRVQGVGFRWFVHREAAELGLRGWVRNTDAGHVEVVASGSEKRLAELKEAVKKGSRGSRVDAVLEEELDESEDAKLGPFVIEGAW
jgi:acylphosphatase